MIVRYCQSLMFLNSSETLIILGKSDIPIFYLDKTDLFKVVFYVIVAVIYRRAKG